jgi:hypothetical protein
VSGQRIYGSPKSWRPPCHVPCLRFLSPERLYAFFTFFYCLKKQQKVILISNFRRVLSVVCFLLGYPFGLLCNRTHPYSVTLLTIGAGYFRAKHSPVGYPNHSQIYSFCTYLPMKMEQIECSETSAYKIQTPGNCPKRKIQQTESNKNMRSSSYPSLPISSCEKLHRFSRNLRFLHYSVSLLRRTL